MRNFKRYISFVAVFAMFFTSCSKEESGVTVESEKATLTFGAIVNDLVTNRSADKQSEGDIPDCSDDTPTYVEVVLMQGDDYILGTTEDPYRVDLAAGQVFTVEDENLELDPGNYSLVHFSVYNDDEDLIWIAPRAGSDLAGYLDRTLPMAIDLRSGVKKYVDVPVLCFDNREVNEYGYLFFEVNTNTAIQYCFFANYCGDDGRHYPASYSVSIWAGNNSSGTPLYSDVTNNTGQYSNGEYFATPLCFALPDSEGDLDEDYLYYEVTLNDWDGVYGDVDSMVKSGTLSKQDIMDTWEGDDDSNYNHLRFNCGADDDNGNGNGNGGGTPPVDSDGDGVPDNIDNCPNTPGPESNNGCPVEPTCDLTDPNEDCDDDGVLNRCDEDNTNYATFDCDGDGVLNGVDNCPYEAGPVSNNGCPVTEPACDIETPDSGCEVAYLEGNESFIQIIDPGASPEFYALLIDGEPVASVTIDINGENDPVVFINAGFGYSIDDYAIEVSQTSDVTTSYCKAENDISASTGDQPDVFEIFDETPNFSYPFYVRIKSNICVE